AQLPLESPQFLLGLVSLGDVEHETHHAHGTTLSVERHPPLHLQPTRRRGRRADAIFGTDLAGVTRTLDRCVHRRPVRRLDKLLPGIVRSTVGTGRDAVHLLELRRPSDMFVDRADTPFEGSRTSGSLREVEHVLARPQLLLDALALSDVATDAVIGHEAAVLVKDRGAAHTEIANGPVQPNAAALEIPKRLARLQYGLVIGP